MNLRRLSLALFLCAFALPGRGDTSLHSLWELHGRHNTVYLLGSIHVLRAQDYPLAPVVLQAYADAKALLMEINLEDVDSEELQSEMLAGAMLPEGAGLSQILGPQRYAHAAALAREVGVDLATFEHFAPWFAAEAISQLQLTELGFDAQSGVEMYFLERAHGDGKSVGGLETVHDQLAVFEALSMNEQSEYLVSSLEQARALPKEVDDMVRAWQRGDTAWFETQLKSELGRDPALYQSVLAARNRKWIPKIEALLNEDKNYLVIVGTGHLVGRNSIVDLLKKDGIGAVQR
ncbi:MAG: TraB/GumN family protein [Steroidobacteraceae bacterium]